MTAADRATLLLLAFILAVGGLGVLIACNATSVETQAMEVRDGYLYDVSSVRLHLGVDVHAHSRRQANLRPLSQCRPPTSKACQPPPRGPRQAARRQFNHDGLGRYWSTWSCLAQRESGWNPRAVGSAGERGLWQVHPIWFGRFDASRLFDPAYNAYAAGVILRLQGWSAWSGAPGCGL